MFDKWMDGSDRASADVTFPFFVFPSLLAYDLYFGRIYVVPFLRPPVMIAVSVISILWKRQRIKGLEEKQMDFDAWRINQSDFFLTETVSGVGRKRNTDDV